MHSEVGLNKLESTLLGGHRSPGLLILVLLPMVSTILLVCSIDIGIGDTFSTYFMAIFDTNTFVVRCTS